jgi:hypothetical protein
VENLRKAAMIIMAVLIGLGLAVTGSPQEVATEKAPQVQEGTPVPGKRIKTTEPVKRFMGEVISFDGGTKVLTAKGRKGESSFDLSNARIARNIRLEDLKQGDRIGVVYIEKDGKKVAKAVGKPMVRSKRSKVTDDSTVQEKPSPAPETR